MTPFRSRPEFLACALQQLVHAVDLVLEHAPEGEISASDAVHDRCGSEHLRRCYAFVFLTAALLPLPHQSLPTLTEAFASATSIRLLFLPPSRGPPPSQR